MACPRSQVCVLAFVGALLLVACSQAPGLADKPPTDDTTRDLEIVAPDVVDVRSLVEWRDGNRYGTYRVITRRGGIDRVQTAIVIQWLAPVMGEEWPSIVASRSVDLLEDLGPVTVAPAIYGKGPNQLTVSVEVKNTVTGEAGRVTSIARGPGQLRTEYVKSIKWSRRGTTCGSPMPTH
jgi:hypothetical protein